MISRRLIRIKVLQIIYAYFRGSDKLIAKAEKELFFSLHRTHDLYFLMISLLIELKKMAAGKMELAKKKNIPTYEDLNPNTKFIDNKLIDQLAENETFVNYTEKNKLNWLTNPELLRQLHQELQQSKEFNKWKNNGQQGYKEDRKGVLLILYNFLYQNELLHQILEERSIFWNDDLDFVLTTLVVHVKGAKATHPGAFNIPELFKNEDDRDFAKDLFRKTILQADEQREIIKQYTPNWDTDRLAVIDMHIMSLALTEIINFPSIPIKVSINEYIELAKYYGTPKSATFINGVLDRAVKQLKQHNKIQKFGRGLIGEEEK